MSEKRVFDNLAPEGVAVLNADDPVSMQCLDRVSGALVDLWIERSFGNHRHALLKCTFQRASVYDFGRTRVSTRPYDHRWRAFHFQLP